MSGANYFVQDNSSMMFPGSFSMMQWNMPSLHFGGLLANVPNTQILPPLQEFALQPQYRLSNNSTSDEGDDQQQQPHHVIDERRQRRMISNRESARRSRMRKQRHLDELWSQVMGLRNENHNLIERLNNMCESHDKEMQENSKLKEETANLRQMLSSFQIGSPYNALQDLDEVPCGTTYLIRTSSSTQSITSPADLLQ